MPTVFGLSGSPGGPISCPFGADLLPQRQSRPVTERGVGSGEALGASATLTFGAALRALACVGCSRIARCYRPTLADILPGSRSTVPCVLGKETPQEAENRSHAGPCLAPASLPSPPDLRRNPRVCSSGVLVWVGLPALAPLLPGAHLRKVVLLCTNQLLFRRRFLGGNTAPTPCRFHSKVPVPHLRDAVDENT